jgi:hypothetical protein
MSGIWADGLYLTAWPRVAVIAPLAVVAQRMAGHANAKTTGLYDGHGQHRAR